MVVPTHPTANLIVRQADFSFPFLKQLLDSVALAFDTDQFGQRHVAESVA
jgi:hypothetical protein